MDYATCLERMAALHADIPEVLVPGVIRAASATLAKIDAASHLTFCQYVVGDFVGRSGPQAIDAKWAGVILEELAETRPRFIVDASRQTWFETDAWIYDLRNYPDFGLNDLLREHYRQTAVLDDCPVWERVD